MTINMDNVQNPYGEKKGGEENTVGYIINIISSGPEQSDRRLSFP